jgi:protein-tyrosine phosphatase
MMKRLFQAVFLLSLVVLTFSCKKDDDTPEEPKNNIQQYVKVSRVAGTPTLTMAFSKQGSWTVYQGTSPESIDRSTVVAETTESSIEISGLDTKQRYYFEVMLDNKDKAIVAETGLAIEGQPNFRDLGGLIAGDKRSVKWGMIYRSGELNSLNAVDVKYMESLQLKKLVDFRFDEEIAEKPDVIPEGIEVINIPVKQGSFTREQLTGWLINNDSEAFDTLLIHANQAFVTDFQEEFGSFLKQLENGEPLVFHCTAGKDRAGFATVLFLSSLGIDKETILEDYMASNTYNAGMIETTIAYVNSKGLNGELLRPVLEVRLEYIEKAYETIDNEYGGMSNYLNLLGVDTEKLKSLYLE